MRGECLLRFESLSLVHSEKRGALGRSGPYDGAALLAAEAQV